jgi:hypothetical protein
MSGKLDLNAVQVFHLSLLSGHVEFAVHTVYALCSQSIPKTLWPYHRGVILFSLVNV